METVEGYEVIESNSFWDRMVFWNEWYFLSCMRGDVYVD